MALARAAATSGGLLQEVSCSSQQLHQCTGESVLIMDVTYCDAPPSCAQEGFEKRWVQGLLTVHWISCVWRDGNGMTCTTALSSASQTAGMHRGSKVHSSVTGMSCSCTDPALSMIVVLAAISAGDLGPACQGNGVGGDRRGCALACCCIPFKAGRLLPRRLPCGCVMVVHLHPECTSHSVAFSQTTSAQQDMNCH